MSLSQSVALNVAFACAALGYGFYRTAAWLLDMEEHKGKHVAPRTMTVESDYDNQTIKIFQSMNQPPAEFFEDGDPNWADAYRTWHFEEAMVDIDRQAAKIWRELFGEKDGGQAA